MKSIPQKWNKVLLPAVLAIWLIVGWRFLNGGQEHTPLANQTSAWSLPTETILEPAVDSLSLDYRDPFLQGNPPRKGRLVAPRRPVQKVRFQPVEMPATVEPPRPLPAFRYQGAVGTDAFTGVLWWEGGSQLVQVGSVIAEAQITAIEPHQLTLTFEDSSYVLRQE